nr:SCP2 sterol-binding domain-containing protein [uncultured Merdimonas sp.]
MKYAEFFSEIKGRFMGTDVSGITEHLAYQFNITGEAEGIFYIEVKDGKLYVEPYEYYDRDAVFTCSEDTLRKIADGKLDPILAVTLRKLKVEGNIDKALKLKTLIEGHK